MLRNFSRHGSIVWRSLIIVALSISQCQFSGLHARAQTHADSQSTIISPYIRPTLRPAIIQKTSEPELVTVVPTDVELKAVAAVSPFKQYSVVVCTVENRTSIPIIIDADHAALGDSAAGSAQNKCASQNDIDAIGRPPTTMKQKFKSNLKATVVAATTLGAVETFQGFKMERKPVPQRYEWDESRREHEEERLGQRLLYPGDTTQGNVYFPLQADQHAGMILSMPVKSFYNGANKAILSGKIDSTIKGVDRKPDLHGQ